MCNIKSSVDLEKIRSSILNYIRFLPGPVTAQKYSGLDSNAKLDTVLYGRILEEIIDKFDRDWPLKDKNLDPLIEKLIIIDGATVFMLWESLRALTTALNETKDERKICVISVLLENLLKSDAIFSGIVDACRYEVQSYMQEEELDQAWSNITQILVSLPNRVSNKLQFDTSKSYTPQVYMKTLCFHISRAISFVNDGLCKCNIEPRTIALSSLISKIVISLKPVNFICFVDILEEWCFENKKNERRLIENVFRELNSAAIEYIATLFLKHCDPKLGVRSVFGNLLMEQNWKYILTTKIPLMHYYEDEKLIVNLISYLSCFLNENILSELLIKLLEVWSDGSILNHAPVEQHEYITKLIILSVKTCKDRLKQTERDQCQKLLLSGVSVHLECTNISLRAMGMMTAEICINSLSIADDVPKLKFDYDNMPIKVSKLLESLRNLNASTVDAKEQYERSGELITENIIFDSLSSRKIYELGIECDILPDLEKKLTHEKIEDSPCTLKNNSIKDNSTRKNEAEQQVKQDSENALDLDSDDDLVPYDMNDDKPSKKERPMYLRDVRDNLTDERTISDPDIFSETLSVCEELILAQLPNDDVSFAIELLQLLVTLKQHCYVENFELVIFKSCVAIVTVYPKESAEFLCKEFYEDFAKYSLNQRLLFLDILAESAKQLSKIHIDASNVEVDTTIKEKRIPSRISLFMDTEERKKQVWYEEDIDIDLKASEEQSINWREIVDKRIASRTRRFAHNSLSKAPKTYINHFGNVVSSFFYPLLHGFGRYDTYKLKVLRIYTDQENILLLRFLKTLSAIMLAAQNCPLASKMGKEILELTWTIRNHEEATVRLVVTENIGSVLIAVPKDAIVDELFESLMEIREWLILSQNVIYGEHDANCRALNAKVLSFINLIIGSVLHNV